mgnify:CR=1 FL=1
MRKDKQQVIGDEISDEYIKAFLQFEPADGVTSPSLHKLVKADRGLRIDDFERFVGFYVEAGFDMDDKDAQGQTIAEQIADQRTAPEYLEIIDNARG